MTPARAFETGLHWTVLAVTLALSCLLGFLTSYVLLVLALAAAVLPGMRRALVPDGVGRVLLGVLLAIGVVFVIDARVPYDALFVVNFVWLAAYAPLASLLARGRRADAAAIVADLALVGAASGAVIAVIAGVGFGMPRAYTITTDPIRLANTALLLGFLATMGVRIHAGPRRWLYLAGPVFAVVAIAYTQSRGALLAFAPMAVLTAVLLTRRRLLALVIGGGLVAAALLAAMQTGWLGPRLARLLGVFGDLASGATIADEQSRIRLELYKAGWAAFRDAPLFGHGWAGMMDSIRPYLSAADQPQAGLPHLHNDLLTLAVAAGLVGVAVYAVLVALPIVACLRTPRDGQFALRLHGTLLLVAGYFVMGLPDTMVAFELHTALYVALMAVLLSYCRDPAR